jgi:hypothetical protein
MFLNKLSILSFDVSGFEGTDIMFISGGGNGGDNGVGGDDDKLFIKILLSLLVLGGFDGGIDGGINGGIDGGHVPHVRGQLCKMYSRNSLPT